MKVFYDEESVTVGKLWADQIRDALTSVDAILILISQFSVESQWLQNQWSAALYSNPVRLLPALISPTDWTKAPPVLADIEYIDLTQDYEGGLEKIVKALPKLQTSKTPNPAAVVDTDRLARDVAERLAERLGIEGQRADRRDIGTTDTTLVFVITSFAEEMEPIFDGISAAANQVALRAERVKDVVGDIGSLSRL